MLGSILKILVLIVLALLLAGCASFPETDSRTSPTLSATPPQLTSTPTSHLPTETATIIAPTPTITPFQAAVVI